MNTEPAANPPAVSNPTPLTPYEESRCKIFIAIQVFFLIVSIFTGGFNYKLWSMLDSALLIQSIGVTGLVPVLDEARLRRLAFRAGIILYLCAVVDMGINVLISGVVGWRHS